MNKQVHSFFLPVFFYRFLSGLLIILSCSLTVAQTASVLAEELGTLESYLKQANEFKKKNQFPEAINCFTKALSISEKEKDSLTMSEILFSFGEINSKMGYNDRAMKHLQRGLSIATALKNKLQILKLRNGIGIIQMDQKDYKASLENFKWLINESLAIGDSERCMAGFVNLGNVYTSLGKIREGKSAFGAGLALAKKMRDTEMEALAYINIADCFRKLNKTDSAIILLKKAEGLNEALTPYDQQILYGGLTLAYEDRKDYKNSLEYFKKHFAVISSVYSTQSDKIVNELEAKYQAEKKEKEILELSSEKLKGKLVLADKQKALNYRNGLLFFSFILLATLLGFAYFLFRQNRLKTSMNKVLVKQNEEISIQKKQIEENLAYTQQLQVALRHDLNHYMQSALRKQMDPHFVFNSLNSIQSFILQNDKLSANQYLSDFAQLMRRVLEHSRKELIPIKEELETLRLYIGLEQKRFDNKFEYVLNVDENITPSVYLIPPFILQPFVENAIWHGLLHKNGKGILEVSFNRKESSITCSIIDNGIGRTAAGQKKAKVITHESLATKITNKRVETLNSLNQQNMSIVIEDLVDKNGIACGTAVHISIPLVNVFHSAIENKQV